MRCAFQNELKNSIYNRPNCSKTQYDSCAPYDYARKSYLTIKTYGESGSGKRYSDLKIRED